MIKEIELINFRCFSHYKVPLKSTTVLVGQNNAGKSTIAEALRLISIVISKFQNLPYKQPNDPDIPVNIGVTPSLKNVDFHIDKTVFHRYENIPAIIKALFDTGELIYIYIGEKEVFAQLFDQNNKLIKSKTEAKNVFINPIKVLPRVAPLQMNEKVLNHDYVTNLMFSRRAPLHFRNELVLFKKEFRTFKQLAESTWKGLRIRNLDFDIYNSQQPISLFIQDNDFVAEVGNMGHGLQMWLQIIWFLSLINKKTTIILDEPDIYMHADLQRKLIRLLMNRKYHQTIIATHSIEIMCEVDTESILIVDHTKKTAKYANSIKSVQKIIDQIGGVHNLQLTRLWAAKKCLLVEGKDVHVLRAFQNTLFPESEEPFDIIPNMPIGGWGGWSYAIGSSMILKNSADETIRVYTILDRDYHTEEEIQERLKQAKEKGVELHIWGKKEMENYLIKPEAILRLINKRTCKRKSTINEVIQAIDSISTKLYDDTLDAMADELAKSNKRLAASTINKQVRKYLNSFWNDIDKRLSVVSGKRMFVEINQWAQKEFGVSLSSKSVAKEIKKAEIDLEMVNVVKSMEENKALTPICTSSASMFHMVK